MDFDAIITGIRKAIYGREVREYIASSMEWTRDFVNQSITNIKELLRQAEAARDAAKASQDAAKVSETNAKASENAARASQNAAASSASAAAGSASAAKTSETNAKASEDAAKASAGNAKASETNAKASENAAKTSETNAKTSETNAKSSETEAATSAANAKTSDSVSGKPSVYPTNWGNVAGKPSSYPPSGHGHYYLADEGDNRSTATTPDNYNNFPNSPHGGIAFRGLKQSQAIGLNIGGGYAYLLGLRGWGDQSGGNAHEIAFTNSGIYVRNGASTSWGSWNKLNTNTITSQTSDPGAGSSLATGSILLVYA